MKGAWKDGEERWRTHKIPVQYSSSILKTCGEYSYYCQYNSVNYFRIHILIYFLFTVPKGTPLIHTKVLVII